MSSSLSRPDLSGDELIHWRLNALEEDIKEIRASLSGANTWLRSTMITVILALLALVINLIVAKK